MMWIGSFWGLGGVLVAFVIFGVMFPTGVHMNLASWAEWLMSGITVTVAAGTGELVGFLVRRFRSPTRT